MTTNKTGTTSLRTEFAVRLSRLYASEVPAYQRLVDVASQVNTECVRARGSDAEVLGSLERVTAERHGAIRVGTARELRQLGQVLSAFGMEPVSFYDLRDATPSPIPVVSTAFRPVDAAELARNPFRLFVSVLVPEDRRFFSPDLAASVRSFLAARTLFPPRLLDLASRAEQEGGLPAGEAEESLNLAVQSFKLTKEPVDRHWYERLAQVSPVAADIAGVPSTHVNHLTPRVLDIDALHVRMSRQGVAMLDRIEGPPRWHGPDVLLRQTSFRALAERRRLREPDGRVVDGTLRVRFGEVESRGVALTPLGRHRYDAAFADAITLHTQADGEPFHEVLRRCWADHFPDTEADLAASTLGHYTFDASTSASARSQGGASSLTALLRDGQVTARAVVYEDFLPKSAAGIFRSNLDGREASPAAGDGVIRDVDWLAGVLGRPVHDPQDLYRRETEASLRRAARALAVDAITDDRSAGPPTTAGDR